ncbi:hypothetical protein NKR23_g5150 [Pleurostoma richardsiae]|uniref:Rhomboid family membrane protein n=1 Tax=Pleurostoma richardsiae TaxID=41990 RepID=A0AA38VJM3_9PEZI|nr:hypothetical protein NKR23_g5150 [Pleurostoma richardsiae]
MSSQPPTDAASPATPPSSSTPSQPENDLKYSGTPEWLHNSAIAVAILGPIALLMPPRRADVRTLVLTGGTFWATNQLAYDWTGRSIQQRFAARFDALAGSGLPEQARRTQELMRAERARREAALPEGERLEAEEARRRREQQGLLQKVWMGGEGENWREERERKEKEALEDGRGYTGLIMEQISEVWGQIRGRKKGDEEAGKAAGGDESPKRPGSEN